MAAHVVAVSRSATHSFSKPTVESLRLVANFGAEDDAHAGATVKHRSRVARDPQQPNLRQIHLVHAELFDELLTNGFTVRPGEIGENITTRDVDLLALPLGTRLRLGKNAVVEITGLRNPCTQLDDFQAGLMAQMTGRGDDGKVVRKAGVMGIVLTSGQVVPGDGISVELPPEPHIALDRI